MQPSKIARSDDLLATFIRELRRQERRQGLTHETAPTTPEELLPHMRLVIQQAQQCQGSTKSHGFTIVDLVQEGYLGLLVALDNFDPKRGVKFGTYARWWIRAKIFRYIIDHAHHKGVRMPTGVEEYLRNLEKIIVILTRELGRAPTPDEIMTACMDRLDITRDQATRLLVYRDMRTVSFDNSPSDDEDTGAERHIPSPEPTPEDTVNHRERTELVWQCVRRLEKRDQVIIILFFGLDGHHEASLAGLGEQLGLSRERVRQLKNSALRALRVEVAQASHKS